jgi:bifunctional non-homologous end joining protein LigD
MAAPQPLLPFTPPMLCTLVERAPEGAGWVHEVKLDGYRMQATVSDGQVRLMTRGGNDWTRRFPETAAALGRLSDAVLDGELVAAGEDGMPDFPALQSAVQRRATARLLFYAFDIMAQGGEDLRDRPLLERKAALKELLRNAPERVIAGAAVLGAAAAACTTRQVRSARVSSVSGAGST